MVAKDYPFYLTVKRANCSLEAPLGSGAAKDEVGRALHHLHLPAPLPPYPVYRSLSCHLPRVVLRFSGDRRSKCFPSRVFSVAPLSPCARELQLLAAASLQPSQTEPRSLSRAGKDTYPLPCQEGPGVKKEAVSKAMSTPPRPGLGKP